MKTTNETQKIPMKTFLDEDRKEKIHNNKEMIISSRLSFFLPVILTLISGILLYLFLTMTLAVFISLFELRLPDIFPFTLYIVTTVAAYITSMLLLSVHSAKLRGETLIIKNFFSRKKEIKISEIDEVITIGNIFIKYLMVRFHENGKEKIIFIMHPSFLTPAKDSYFALVYAHYYFKKNIKIY